MRAKIDALRLPGGCSARGGRKAECCPTSRFKASFTGPRQERRFHEVPVFPASSEFVRFSRRVFTRRACTCAIWHREQQQICAGAEAGSARQAGARQAGRWQFGRSPRWYKLHAHRSLDELAIDTHRPFGELAVDARRTYGKRVALHAHRSLGKFAGGHAHRSVGELANHPHWRNNGNQRPFCWLRDRDRSQPPRFRICSQPHSNRQPDA